VLPHPKQNSSLEQVEEPASRPGSHAFTSPLKYSVGPEPYPVQTESTHSAARSSSHWNPTFCHQQKKGDSREGWEWGLQLSWVPGSAGVLLEPPLRASPGLVLSGASCCRNATPAQNRAGAERAAGPLLPPSPHRLQDKPLPSRGLPGRLYAPQLSPSMRVSTESRAGALCWAGGHTMVVRNIVSNKTCCNTSKSLALLPGFSGLVKLLAALRATGGCTPWCWGRDPWGGDGPAWGQDHKGAFLAIQLFPVWAPGAQRAVLAVGGLSVSSICLLVWSCKNPEGFCPFLFLQPVLSLMLSRAGGFSQGWCKMGISTPHHPGQAQAPERSQTLQCQWAVRDFNSEDLLSK